MRLWCCSPGCAEVFAETPRPWPVPLDETHCPTCGEVKPDSFAYLVAKTGLDAAYFRWTMRPLIVVGGYLLIACDATWKTDAWEQLASGLQLGVAEIFDDAVDAYRVAAQRAAIDPQRVGGYRRP